MGKGIHRSLDKTFFIIRLLANHFNPNVYCDTCLHNYDAFFPFNTQKLCVEGYLYTT